MNEQFGDDIYQEYLLEDEFGADENWNGLAKQISRYFMIKLGSATIGYPFELARLLRQIQYRSNDSDLFPEEPLIADDKQDPIKEPSLNNSKQELSRFFNERPSSYDLSLDSSGYPTTSPNESQWPMVLDKHQGLGSTALLIARRQGLLKVWQGLAPYWIHRVSFDFSRATIEETLQSNELVDRLLEDRLAISPSIDIKLGVVPVVSEIISGMLLSPLEVIQTRLAVQSVYPGEQRYSGMLSCASSIINTEGGIRGLFPDFGLTATLKVLGPSLRILPLNAFSHFFDMLSLEDSLLSRLIYFAGHFAILSVPLLVLQPLETIRRRLLVQGPHSLFHYPLIPRVPVRKEKYSGFWNCLYHMIREEGIASLYQGLSFQLTSNFLLLALSMASEINEDLPEDFEEF